MICPRDSCEVPRSFCKANTVARSCGAWSVPVRAVEVFAENVDGSFCALGRHLSLSPLALQWRSLSHVLHLFAFVRRMDEWPTLNENTTELPVFCVKSDIVKCFKRSKDFVNLNSVLGITQWRCKFLFYFC